MIRLNRHLPVYYSDKRKQSNKQSSKRTHTHTQTDHSNTMPHKSHGGANSRRGIGLSSGACLGNPRTSFAAFELLYNHSKAYASIVDSRSQQRAQEEEKRREAREARDEWLEQQAQKRLKQLRLRLKLAQQQQQQERQRKKQKKQKRKEQKRLRKLEQELEEQELEEQELEEQDNILCYTGTTRGCRRASKQTKTITPSSITGKAHLTPYKPAFHRSHSREVQEAD